ncbi:MAG: DnaJ domain-containing protein [Thermodesulfobacteriota bacterium]
MYLARITQFGRTRYLLRESCVRGRRLTSRDLYDLGEDPSAYIVYPGGNSFYFDQDLIRALNDQGVTEADRELELLLLPFLPPHIRRIVVQMTRLGRKKKRDLSREAMARAQARLHLFDRRRFFFLRFGRMDPLGVMMRPHKFLNVLGDMSRDEIECYFQEMEVRLRVREKKQYVYLSLGLDRYFPGEAARLFPQGLPEERLDRAFMTEICRLNLDPAFLDPGPEEKRDGSRLCDYLVRYAVMWFDFEFGMKSPAGQIFEEFVRRRSRYVPPPRGREMGLARACRVFSLTEVQWREMDRDQIGKAYRRLAFHCHPDRGGDPEEFLELNLAYQRLIQGK